ncbi:MAG: SDR family oxidoreductase [Deltaproteobacteria bacterium]|nr:SDR family oxidoreductase [Deltaproteobacteria bacterium]MBW2362406.1 SDR family oxidoreductase [Deltaproteobacteria bacterium]
MASPLEAGGRPLAVVTGATSGIGEAFALRLAQRGYDVVLVARRRERLAALANRIVAGSDVDAEVLAADLLVPDERRLVEERLFGDPRVELLVNSAGFGSCGRFAELDPERLVAELQLNGIANMRLMRAALPAMLQRGRGSIVNVASSTGFQPNPYFANYGATKAFLTSVSQAVAEECRGTGVRILAVCPGPVRTEFAANANLDDGRFPGFTLVTTDQVVDVALRALENGKQICIPGAAMSLTAWLTPRLPGFVSRAFYRWFGRRFYLEPPDA